MERILPNFRSAKLKPFKFGPFHATPTLTIKVYLTPGSDLAIPGPKDPYLLLVLLLFVLEGELDEDLLQLLVHVVDAKLLEAVSTEDLEPVDVQNAQVESLAFGFHGDVDGLATGQHKLGLWLHILPVNPGGSRSFHLTRWS